MAWAAVSDEAHSDERTHEAGAEAMGLWVTARSWMAHKLSDGRIPAATARALARSLGIARPAAAIDRLVKARRWRPEGVEFVDVDYLNENPTREEVLAKRASTKNRVEGWRHKRANAKNDAENQERTGVEMYPCNVVTNTVTNGVGNAHVTPLVTRLSPSPISLPSVERETPIVPLPGTSELGVSNPPGPSPRGPSAADVRRVFEAWQRLHSSPRSKLDKNRTRRIRSRLGEGFTVADLERAIAGAKHDDWLMGRAEKSTREYREVDTILRDAAQVERLIGLWQAHEGGGADTPEARASADRRAELVALADRAIDAQRGAARTAPRPDGGQTLPGLSPFPPVAVKRPLRAAIDAELETWRAENPLSL